MLLDILFVKEKTALCLNMRVTPSPSGFLGIVFKGGWHVIVNNQ